MGYIILILEDKPETNIPNTWVYAAKIKEESYKNVTDAIDKIQEEEGI